VQSGNLLATAVAAPGLFTLDVRGYAFLSVSDTGLPPTDILIADITGGTDSTGAVLPFGNAYLLAVDAASGPIGQADLLFFDFANFSMVGPMLTVPVYATPFPAGSTPDPALATLVDHSPTPFQFNFSQVLDVGNGASLGQWQLSSIGDPVDPVNSLNPVDPVPEPGALSMLFGGVLVVAGIGWRKVRA
jgi:hypothetical protein